MATTTSTKKSTSKKSRSVTAGQAAAAKAQADRIKATTGLSLKSVQEGTSSRSRSKKSGQTGEALTINKSTNEIVGRSSGKVYGKGTNLQEALAIQTKLQSGSAPTVSGRPDLLATTPGSLQKVESFQDPSTKTLVTPRVATTDELAQKQAGTLQSFNAAQGLTYLDGNTFKQIQPLLSEEDLIRGPEGQIWLKQGLSVEDVQARQVEAAPEQGDITAPDFSVDLPDAFSTDALSEFLSSPATDQDFSQLMAEIQAKQEELTSLLTPTETEQDLKREILDLKNEAEKTLTELSMGLNDIEDQPIAMQFITGQQASIERRAEAKLQNIARLEQNLLYELGLEEEARKVKATVAQTQLGYLQTNLDVAFKVREMIQQEEDRIFARSQALSSKAQQTLSFLLESMQGMDESNLTSDQLDTLNSLSKSAGIPFSLVLSGMSNIKHQLSLKKLDDSALTDAQRLSAAQTLMNNGLAADLSDALHQVDLAISGGEFSTKTPGGESDFVTSSGAWDIGGYVEKIGGRISQDYDNHVSYIAGREVHGGYDIAAPEGTTLIAPATGKVTKVLTGQKHGSGWGNFVEITDDQGNIWKLAHMKDVTVQVGDIVGSGTKIGTVGNTGYSTGPHTHIELHDSSGKLIDPSALVVSSKGSKSSTGVAPVQDWANDVKSGFVSFSDVPSDYLAGVTSILREEGLNPNDPVQQAEWIVTGYKTQGYTREMVENQYIKAGVEIPQSVSLALDTVFGEEDQGGLWSWFSELFD